MEEPDSSAVAVILAEKPVAVCLTALEAGYAALNFPPWLGYSVRGNSVFPSSMSYIYTVKSTRERGVEGGKW